MPPSQVGPYEILAVIGKGGIGTVYRARHHRTGELAAVKLLGPGPAIDPTAARRLAREFETLADLDHPNVVRVFEAGVSGGYPYLAMELVEGLDLRAYLSPTLDDSIPAPSPEVFAALVAPRSHGGSSSASLSAAGLPLATFDLGALAAEPDTDALLAAALPERRQATRGARALEEFAKELEEPETDLSMSGPWSALELEAEIAKLGEVIRPPALDPAQLEALNRPARVGRLKDVLLQVCEGLAYVHARGLVHRDLKPSNIMVDDDRRARLMDFGLVKMVADETDLTATGRVVGTYRYMAPEQAMGEPVDGRADLYSLGVILYELLAGRPPFDARNAIDLWQQVLEHEPAPLGSINTKVDYQLARVAHRLLRKDAAERFQTAEEVFEALAEG